MSQSLITPVAYQEGKLLLLDQTRLPAEEIYIEIKTKEDLWDAIYHLKVRGAPAIGVAAAYGLYQVMKPWEWTRPEREAAARTPVEE